MRKQVVISFLVAVALLVGQPLFAKSGGGGSRMMQQRKQVQTQQRKQVQKQQRKQEQKQQRKQEQKQAIIKAFDDNADGKLSKGELDSLRQLLETMNQGD